MHDASLQAACSAGHAARPARASVSRWLRRHAGAWPRQCELCRAWGRTPLCGACVSRFAAQRPRCRRCALPIQTIEVSGSDVCGECLREPPPFDAAVAALDYGFPWDGLIARFKFRQQPELARALAQRLIDALARSVTEPVDVLLPMPLSAQRLRERGYNQAWELTRKVGDSLAIATQPDVLQRWLDTPHQVGLAKAARETNLRQAMGIAPRLAERIRGRHIALVDDVMTTGASANAATHVLRSAGAKTVQLWVLARTPRPGTA